MAADATMTPNAMVSFVFIFTSSVTALPRRYRPSTLDLSTGGKAAAVGWAWSFFSIRLPLFLGTTA
jgi:hypothetical protein